jgi:hypothetical protein
MDDTKLWSDRDVGGLIASIMRKLDAVVAANVTALDAADPWKRAP